MDHLFADNPVESPLLGDEDGVFEAPGREQSSGPKPWDRSTDVLVVGFGGAGASAALEALSEGTEVLIVDRFGGGGATKLSGGVVYLGGGTELQLQAGYQDTPEEMFNYVSQEAGSVVGSETIRAFCESSVSTFEWLRRLGVPFPALGEALKTSYPPDDCTLYFSGNELSHPYSQLAQPAPRGHRALGKGLTGRLLFKCLEREVARSGIPVLRRTKASRLVVDRMGAVLGVELLEIPEHPLARVVHRALADLVSNCGSISRSAARVGQRLLALFEKRWGRVVHVRARGGVVLCTGGFVFNPRAVAKSAPAYSCCKMRIGTAGDTGSGIALGLSAGAAVAKLERCCGFRFINPPSALVGGVLVGPEGDRVCNEELYGATLCEKLVAEHGGKGYLVLDSVALRAARRQLGREPMGLFQLLFGSVNVFLNRKKGRSLEALALKLGINSRNLVDAIEDYNAGIDRGADSEGKADRYLRKIGSPPFYGIDCSVGSALFPTPYFTLGGLKVAGVTARAIDLDGREIPGLYAAGRTAIGISSNSYVSGLSVADCLFSGRNAGGDAASRALGTAAAKK